MAAARHKACIVSCGQNRKRLFTLVNRLTDKVGSKVILSDSPSLSALLKLEEMYVDKFYQAFRISDFSDTVTVQPGADLNSL